MKTLLFLAINIKRILLGFFLLMLVSSCAQTNSQQKMITDFQFSECEALYKGKPLPFGKPIAEWEKLFGQASRVLIERTYIWDNLGIAVSAEKIYDENEMKNINKMYIFYANLDSPAGQEGKLKYAYQWRSSKSLIEGYKKGNPEALTKQLEQEFIKDKSIGGYDGPDKYIYPYTTYPSSVSINGAEIAKGMSLKHINKNREALSLVQFTFKDNNMNGKNERGLTKGKDGEYWDDVTDNRCEKQGFYFYSSVGFSDSELEFIKIGYLKSNEDIIIFGD